MRWSMTRGVFLVHDAATKLCKRCNTHKPLLHFSPRADAKDGLAYWCTPCKTAATAAGPRRKQVLRNYRERHADVCKQRVKACVTAKPEHYAKKAAAWAQANKERVLAGRRAAYKKNAAQEIARVRLRKKRTDAAPAWLLPGHHAEIEGLYRFCQLFRGFEVDHVIPLNGKQVSGLHVPENLQVLTVRANRQKGAKFEVV